MVLIEGKNMKCHHILNSKRLLKDEPEQTDQNSMPPEMAIFDEKGR